VYRPIAKGRGRPARRDPPSHRRASTPIATDANQAVVAMGTALAQSGRLRVCVLANAIGNPHAVLHACREAWRHALAVARRARLPPRFKRSC
jgi:hypothetical protein